jgi:LPPG:FO 2-phospho-L-lactate transferase
VIGNTADDLERFGLRVCPDLDTLMYTLAGVGNDRTGWGRDNESWSSAAELAAFGQDTWFELGDRDLATHVLRTELLRHAPLSAVTARLCARWDLGVELLPATDEFAVNTVRLTDGRTVHFQEWWIAMHADEPAVGFDLVPADPAPAPGTLAAIESADLILFAPSNPVVSIGMILRVAGLRAALRAAAAPIVGLAPIVGGHPVLGRADACLAAIGVQTSAHAVAAHFGSRSAGGLLDGWLVDTADRTEDPEVSGIRTVAVPLLMSDVIAAAQMAREAIELGRRVSALAGTA